MSWACFCKGQFSGSNFFEIRRQGDADGHIDVERGIAVH